MVKVLVEDFVNNFLEIYVIFLLMLDIVCIFEDVFVGVVIVYVVVIDWDFGMNGYVICMFDYLYFKIDRLEVNEYKVIVV